MRVGLHADADDLGDLYVRLLNVRTGRIRIRLFD